SQHVPTAAGRQRNFTAEGDAMVLVNAGHDRWLQFGVRLKHISNGLTAYENPGVDNRMLFGGISWRVRAPR
ncbi:MAG TPA: acyloxyacyl hydrolase, partial [Gemmatimonadaceae bacterium]|nr:acyloxyacyl hydrolase [Gemmatimonadaceae bacterium]